MRLSTNVLKCAILYQNNSKRKNINTKSAINKNNTKYEWHEAIVLMLPKKIRSHGFVKHSRSFHPVRLCSMIK